MFQNISDKIKTLAIVCTVIGILGSIIGGIVLCTVDLIAVGIIVMLLGSIFSWIASFVLYGFGELIEKTCEIAKNTKRSSKLAIAEALEKNTRESDNTETAQIFTDVIEEVKEEKNQEKLEQNPDFDPENIASDDECPACFHKIKSTDTECTYCGYKLK